MIPHGRIDGADQVREIGLVESLYIGGGQEPVARPTINLSLTTPLQSEFRRDGTGDRAGSRKKKPTA
jgi:hypothetical protein